LSVLSLTLFCAGVQLDVSASNVILYSSFDRIFSSLFCGSKAADLCCALNTSPAATALCVATTSSELDLSLQSFDQIYRRLLKFAHEKLTLGADKRPLELVMFVDETGVTEANDGTAAQYSDTITTFLRNMWNESYDKVQLCHFCLH
jgi:hypothetical protein